MRPQFPGMDPWLEHPDLWPDVHNSLIASIRDALTPLGCSSLFRRCGVTDYGSIRSGHGPHLPTGYRRSRAHPGNPPVAVRASPCWSAPRCSRSK